MADNLVILIHGKAFAGKDSVYNTLRIMTSKYFQNITYNDYQSFVNNVYTETVPEFLMQHVEHCIRVPFADEVKKELCRINPKVDYQRLMSDPVYKSSFRKELVEIGDGYRQDDPAIWVKKHRETFFPLLKKISKKVVFITDVRYVNEYNYGEEIEKETNNIVLRIKIDAPLPDRLTRMSYDAVKKYVKYSKYNAGENMEEISERAGCKLKWDLVIDNPNFTPSNSFNAIPYIPFLPVITNTIAYNGYYTDLFKMLSPQLQTIAKLYENMREARI